MTSFKLIAPWIIVGGYAITILLITLGLKRLMRSTDRRREAEENGTDPAEDGSVSTTDKITLLMLLVGLLLGVATTIFGLMLALDPQGVAAVVGLIVIAGLLLTAYCYALKGRLWGKNVLRGTGGLIGAAYLWFVLLPPVLYLVGLTNTVRLHVVESFTSTSPGRLGRGGGFMRDVTEWNHVTGYYVSDSGAHEQLRYLAVSLPKEGSTITVDIVPIWPNPVYESLGFPLTTLILGLAALALFWGGGGTILRRRRRKKAERAESQDQAGFQDEAGAVDQPSHMSGPKTS